jgi:hypothetical protein
MCRRERYAGSHKEYWGARGRLSPAYSERSGGNEGKNANESGDRCFQSNPSLYSFSLRRSRYSELDYVTPPVNDIPPLAASRRQDNTVITVLASLMTQNSGSLPALDNAHCVQKLASQQERPCRPQGFEAALRGKS